MTTSLVVANNRGGIGKSTVAGQLAMHRARSNSEVKVALLDFTSAGDVSCHLLGGTREPVEAFEDAITEGQRGLLQLPERHRAATLFKDAKRAPTGIGAVLSNFGLGGGFGPGLRDRLFLTPSGVHLLAGGPELKDSIDSPEQAQAIANKIRSMIASLPGVWEVIIDIDAEFRERMHSLIGLLIADRAIVVLSDRWADYCRFMRVDPYNALFPTLQNFAGAGIHVARIHRVVFNGSRAVKFEPADYLDFTPAAAIKKEIDDITEHMYEKAFVDVGACSGIYMPIGQVTDVEAFRARFVASLPRLPDAAIADSLQSGKSITQSPARGHAGASLDALAKRVFD